MDPGSRMRQSRQRLVSLGEGWTFEGGWTELPIDEKGSGIDMQG